MTTSITHRLTDTLWDSDPRPLLRWHGETSVADIAADGTPGFTGNKKQAQRAIEAYGERIADLQDVLYANGIAGGSRRLLLVLQGMDASGKGGIVRHVFHQGNPMGIHYHGFGKPTEEESSHEFLWRIRKELPEPGWISVFDRSHYEDIVVPHVTGSFPETVWRPRYETIREFETQLVNDGCAVIKVFLVSSKQAQLVHFLERLDNPQKYWKFDPSDLQARARWDDYMDAWRETFEHTDADAAPWYLVPADHRWYSRLVVSTLLYHALQDMGLNWPSATCDLAEAKRLLSEETCTD